ncbi:hypothetical protein CR513_03216, partial [Mucuna pruriens]
MEIYTNADNAGSVVDRRSTSKYCMCVVGNLITWRSKKQNMVVRFNIILNDIKVKYEGPMKLFYDNNSTINIVEKKEVWEV